MHPDRNVRQSLFPVKIFTNRLIIPYFPPQCANLGDIRSNHEPTVTYEGDNNVLSQQTGNWLLRQYASARAQAAVDSPIGTVTFLADHARILQQVFHGTETRHLKTAECELNY